MASSRSCSCSYETLYASSTHSDSCLPTTSTRIPCVTYRCRVKLVSNRAPSSLPNVREKGHHSLVRSSISMLRLRRNRKFFSSSDIIAPQLMQSLILKVPCSSWLRSRLRSPITATSSLHSGGIRSETSLSLASIVTTALLSLFSLSMQQRLLLRSLLASFDFWFVSCQVSMLAVVLCRLSCWEKSFSFAIANSSLWIHWILSFDALTPIVRNTLSVSVIQAGFVLGIVLVGQCALVICLLPPVFQYLDDIVILTFHVHDRSFKLSATPFIISLVLVIFPWLSRLLCRFYTHSDGELIIITGAVEYEDKELRRHLGSVISIVPTATAPSPIQLKS